MKLLCVDSEPAYREIISLCAQEENLEVHTASTYKEAMEAFLEHEPDIVTLDVLIKGGNAFNLVKEFKAIAGERLVPIVFVTSNSSDLMMDQCFVIGADDFIPKPFNEQLFNIRLKAHMRNVQLMQEMYGKNKTLTYFQTMIEREHEMAHQVLNHIQNRNEINTRNLAVTRLSAASFNGDLALVKTRIDNSTLIFVGDFTGHGLSASIGALPIMQAFFDAVDELTEVSDLVTQINRMLLSILPDYMFCAGYLMLISEQGEISYWGGGMPDALILRDSGSLDAISSNHMPLGILPIHEFESDFHTSQLHDGDTLLIASDGVLELKNNKNEMLGKELLKAYISQAYSNNEEDLRVSQFNMEKKLSRYLGECEQLDDITLVAYKKART
ncbi:fused response regulator/phosphatase [Marinomonas sp. C2222]|uniref:Fused response regulator/phosphatase n=1 Tax=Marinomonas sargassi TaxID=2984494 RepID=A0ABT2YSC8_9GAMM|nr:fused response regulator/phosphatase [Marinomonas sargassi]MCV2402786.1 fused response regulator/phosphatase [Marinomonas sargassi]